MPSWRAHNATHASRLASVLYSSGLANPLGKIIQCRLSSKSSMRRQHGLPLPQVRLRHRITTVHSNSTDHPLAEQLCQAHIKKRHGNTDHGRIEAVLLPRSTLKSTSQLLVMTAPDAVSSTDLRAVQKHSKAINV